MEAQKQWNLGKPDALTGPKMRVGMWLLDVGSGLTWNGLHMI